MDVSSIGPMSGGQPIRRTSQPAAPPAAPAPIEARPVSPKDELHLSSVDTSNTQVQMESDFRAQRLAQIQQQIAEGVYDTPEKMEIAFERMLESVLAEPS